MNKFLKWVIYITIGLVPFLAFYVTSANPTSMQMLFPYITGKNFAFRILIEIAAAAWLMLMIINRDYRPKKSLLLYAYSAFVFILLLADIFSVNMTRSFFSNFERMEGFIAHAHLFLYFLILISVFKTREMWENAKVVLFISNIPVLILAFLQLFGLNNVFSNLMPALRDSIHKYFAPSQGGLQLDASLGNSTYLAIYTVFFIFLFFMSFVENKLKNKNYAIYIVMMILNLIALFYTGTRGAQLGFILGVFTSAIIIYFAGKRFNEIKSLRKYALSVLIVLAIGYIALLLVGNTNFAKNSTSNSFTKIVKLAKVLNPFTIGGKAMEVKEKLYNGSSYQELLSVTGDGTMTSRFLNWKMGIDGFKENPVLGWGQDNYFYVFAKYNDPRMYAQEPWFDRSHNVFFDWLIAAGALGLLAYLSLYFVAIYTMWFAKATRKHHDSYSDFIEKSLITGLITAYFIHNIFVFDNIISYILFFSILAYIGVRFDHTEEMKTKTEDKKSSIIKNVDDRVVLYGPFIIVILSASLYYFNFQYIKANFAIIRGLSPQQEASDTSPVDALNRSLIGFKDAADIGGIATMESREQLAQQTLNLISQIRQANLPQNDQTLPIYKLVYDFIETTKLEYKDLIDSQKNKDPRSLSIYASFLRSIGENEEALKFSKLAYESAPMKQTIAIDYVQTLLITKNYTEALNVSEKTYKSDKTFDQAKAAHALALAYNGKFDEAVSILPEIKDNLDKIKAEIGK